MGDVKGSRVRGVEEDVLHKFRGESGLYLPS